MDNSNEMFNDNDLYGPEISEENQPAVQILNAAPQHNINNRDVTALLYAVMFNNHRRAEVIALIQAEANIQAGANVNNNGPLLPRPGL